MCGIVVIKGEDEGSESVEKILLHLIKICKHDLYITYRRVHEA